jgi:hypothetical protein
MAKGHRRADGLPVLELVAHGEIPLREVSGLALARWAAGTFLVAVGDHGPDVSYAAVGAPGSDLGEWQVVDLSELDSPPGAPRVEQAEAIATDGDRQAVVLIEDPPLLLLLDVPDRRLTRAFTLEAVGLPGLESWMDDASSRGEGLVLLRDGHVLVVKEKRPAGLIEFGPPGDEPQGISEEKLHPAAEPWDAPPGDRLTALAWWPADGLLADLSDAAIGPDGGLYLLSDQSSAIGRLVLPLAPTPGAAARFERAWSLPPSIVKAEGLAFLPDGSALVAVDRPDHGRNVSALPPLDKWPGASSVR